MVNVHVYSTEPSGMGSMLSRAMIARRPATETLMALKSLWRSGLTPQPTSGVAPGVKLKSFCTPAMSMPAVCNVTAMLTCSPALPDADPPSTHTPRPPGSSLASVHAADAAHVRHTIDQARNAIPRRRWCMSLPSLVQTRNDATSGESTLLPLVAFHQKRA